MAASHRRPGWRSPAFAIDDLFGDHVPGRTEGPVCALEDHKGHFESDAHETGGLRVKPVALQVQTCGLASNA
jgi:hypothetical protein